MTTSTISTSRIGNLARSAGSVFECLDSSGYNDYTVTVLTGNVRMMRADGIGDPVPHIWVDMGGYAPAWESLDRIERHAVRAYSADEWAAEQAASEARSAAIEATRIAMAHKCYRSVLSEVK